MILPFVEENTQSRHRLETLTARLTDQDLTRSTSYGWTVAVLLAHLAFWDQRALALIRRWTVNGFASPIDSVAVNDALKPFCHALNPRAPVELCIASAKAVDAELETITPDLYEQIQKQSEATTTQFRFVRALHRNDHLNDIEALIKS